MAKRRVVFVVGHANWGKSRTLRALTGGNIRQRRIQIGGVEFFIRRMSNDDEPREFYPFIRDVQPAEKPDLIVAFCPEFQKPEEQQIRRCLERLREKGYKLFFWVLREQYGGERFVTPDEIEALQRYGTVEVFELRQAEDQTRAIALRAFVEDTVLA